ncbi:MAG TPA: pantoate--beta-alanine ligase [Candidatus Dormibacteraeota bacterium]|nr:pantoate--beta-alanine ligase [Candidatus Dormibacteraeota bacterium]
MELIHTVDWMKQVSRQAREEGGIVGLVPTGGGLHAGHLSLVEAAHRECSPVVVSVFSDPRDRDPAQGRGRPLLDADRAALESLAANYLFAPSPEEFFPPDFQTSVIVSEITERLEGRSRPGHLRAVAATVLKLFAIIQPAFIYVGRREAQRACMLRRMARDLNLDTRIVVGPIVREPDGLAVSSRNACLNDDERRAALALPRALAAAREQIARGERMAGEISEKMSSVLASEPLATVDYVEIVDADTFGPAPRLRGSCLAVVAAFIGPARLTDNMLIEEENGHAVCFL